MPSGLRQDRMSLAPANNNSGAVAYFKTYRKQLNYLEDKHMRTLEGYSEQEQKELEDAKKFMNCNYLINNITSYRSNTECGFVKDKYDEAETDEQISIIKDILDFYTGEAKFEEQKYCVHFIKNNECSYLSINPAGGLGLGSRLEHNGWKTKFTHEEMIAMNPQLLLFEEEVEDNE